MAQPLSRPFWKVLCGTVLLGNTLGVLFGLVLLAQPADEPPPTAAAPELQAVKEQAERLKIQFDYWDKRAAQLQTMLGMLLALNSLYAVALAAGTYFNLKPMLDSARRELDDLRRFSEKADGLIDDARTDLVEFRSEIRSDLPTLQNMDKALRNILTDIRRHLPTDKDWAQPSYYTNLSLAEREQIRYAELTVAGFKFFELGRVVSFGTTVSEIYRGLGQFYGSYFLTSRAVPGGPDISLYERSLLYFEEARAVQPDNAATLAATIKDIGVLYTRQTANPQWPRMARQAFEHSLQLDPAEPGALFGLGWLDYLDDKWELAIARYSAMIDKKEWTDADRRKYLPDAYLNRACCRARSLTAPAGNDILDLLVADCNDSIRVAQAVGEWAAFRPRLVKELGSTGDIKLLAQQSPERVKEILA